MKTLNRQEDLHSTVLSCYVNYEGSVQASGLKYSLADRPEQRACSLPYHRGILLREISQLLIFNNIYVNVGQGIMNILLKVGLSVWDRNSLLREHEDFSLCRPFTCSKTYNTLKQREHTKNRASIDI